MRNITSIRHKLIAVVLLTTFTALVVASILILAYDINSYRSARALEMTAQTELLAYATAPALQFGDENVARENLSLLEIRDSVISAAIYDGNGNIFATYVRGDEAADLPAQPGEAGVVTSGDRMQLTEPIFQNGVRLGTAYIESEFLLRQRVISFMGILGLVTLGAMFVAVALAALLQSRITRPILSIADIARHVVAEKEYSRRAEKLTDDEVGLLVDDFNAMLKEIEIRTTALQKTNSELEQEIVQRKRAREEVLRLNEELERKVHELNEADRHKDDFLATLAHELRNPLAPIRSGLALLRRVDDGKKQEIYSILERQSNQLVHLVDELMDVSRISRGKITLMKKDVALEDILRSAIEATSDLMEHKQHNFIVLLPEEPVKLHADPVRLTQVFLNLLSNAAHYTPDEGNIILQARARNGELEVCVQDSGIGMSEEMLDKVFEAFMQFENTLTKDRNQSGLGIGLTLARALVEMHGGTIQAHSEGPGRGTEFVVRLPLEAAALPPARPQPEEEIQGGSQQRVMVVDDNEDAAMTLAMLLRLNGCEVRAVFSGSAALESGEQFQPDIILMDLGMPGMSGIDAAKTIRNTAWGRDVSLVAITGWGQEEDKRKTEEAGFDHHLVKPVEAADLLRLLDALQASSSP